MRTVAIIQARMGSTRLPGKVLKPLGGRPMLAQVITRAKAATGIDEVVVATTELSRDEVLVGVSRAAGAGVFRGSEDDVLSRYAGAAAGAGAERVVRITSDCPLHDPGLIDEMLAAHLRHVAELGPVDLYANTIRRTYPRGLDTEIFPRETLDRLDREAADPRAREHVTWQMYKRPAEFRLADHVQPGGRDDSHHRWTVDTPEDFDLAREVYDALGGAGRLFSWTEVRDLLARRPDLLRLNADIEQKKA